MNDISQEDRERSPVPAHHRTRRRFNFAHSLAGVALLLGLEGAAAGILDVLLGGAHTAGVFVVLIGSVIGGLFIILIATEVIEEVRRPLHMLVLLSGVVFQFMAFFAFQYGFLSLAAPGSFESLLLDPVSLLLHSTAVFALNPLYLPTTTAARALLLINTLESLTLAFFVLQNVWQIRRDSNGDGA